MSLKERLVRWWYDEEGATVTEYALLLALVVVVLVATLTQLGSTLQTKLNEIIETLKGAGN